jgi:Tol biopolymer transport system component
VAVMASGSAGVTRSHRYRAGSDGSGLTQITHGAGSDYPNWSPSGQLLAAVTTSGAIVVMHADGSGAHTVSPARWTSSDPTWTPTGKLVFLAERGSRLSSYIVNPSGTGLRRLYPNLEGAQAAIAQFTWGAGTLPAGKCNSAQPPAS